MDKISQGKTNYKGSKEYDQQYVWGQLVGWFKQTVANPNASLSAERRGTLSIPDVSSFVIERGKINTIGSTKRKKTKKAAEKDSDDEVIHPTSMGSRSRPSKQFLQ